MKHLSVSRRRLLAWTCCAAGSAWVGSSGCQRSNLKTTAERETAPPAKLRVIVVDDPELGQSIKREWRSHIEGDVEVEELTISQLGEAERLPGDAIVFPASMLGHLVERGLIRPLREELLGAESVALHDVFPLTRRHEITWGGEYWALPLGSPQFVLAYRADLLAKLELAPPATWDEYQAAVVKLADRQLLTDAAPEADQLWRATAEPIGTGFGGNLLLARAAAYASHIEQVSPLFDKGKMEPLIDRPPYVRALSEMIRSIKAAGLQPVESAAAAVGELLAGRCAMALTWPMPQLTGDDSSSWPAVAFAELPGSPDVYHFQQQTWLKRGPKEEIHIPFLGTAGRLASILSSSNQSAIAENLVGWLSSTEVSSRAASRSGNTTIFRTSHKSTVDRWLSHWPAAAADQYFEIVQSAQSRSRALATVRLPGANLYLAALDRAVQRAVAEGQEPQAALTQAAEDWRQITTELGRTAQSAALARMLGLEAG